MAAVDRDDRCWSRAAASTHTSQNLGGSVAKYDLKAGRIASGVNDHGRVDHDCWDFVKHWKSLLVYWIWRLKRNMRFIAAMVQVFSQHIHAKWDIVVKRDGAQVTVY